MNDKQQGVCPIGMGEVPQCITTKAVHHLIDLDIRETVTHWCEAAVHAMRHLFRVPGHKLLMDASNAFNSVNQQAALHIRMCACMRVCIK